MTGAACEDGPDEPGFPYSPERLTTAWIEAALRKAGLMQGGGIAAIEARPFGTGQVGESVRIAIRYMPGSSGPATLVAKFGSRDPQSREGAAGLRVYEREVRFYREYAPRLAVRTARVLASELDESGRYFALLFDDLAPARAGNQLAGCTLADALLAVREAAAIHAPSMTDPLFMRQGWLTMPAAYQAHYLEAYPACHAVFRERYKDQLEPALLAVCDRFAEAMEAWLYRPFRRLGLVHGDFRLDNMLFDARGGAQPIAVVDWQTIALADPLIDVGYFLGTGIGSALRRPHERQLLDAYCAEMTARGVPMTTDEIWDDYCVGALYGLWLAVYCTAMVPRSERGDLNFLSMARGAAELALDNDSVLALLRLTGGSR